jgi:hypothetical protein
VWVSPTYAVVQTARCDSSDNPETDLLFYFMLKCGVSHRVFPSGPLAEKDAGFACFGHEIPILEAIPSPKMR